MPDEQNVAQRVTDALIKFTAIEDQISPPLAALIGEIVAAIAELDARTSHVQR